MVKDNGFFGTVKGVSFNSIQQEWEYYVAWDIYPGQGPFCYVESDVEDLWEKIARIKDALSSGIILDPDPLKYYVNQDGDISLPVGNMAPQEIKRIMCGAYDDHKWVEVGFTHTKTVCYYCDKEKT
jgi:hypothetical protein